MKKLISTILPLLALCIASPAIAQTDALDDLLSRTGMSVTRFLNQLGDVRCNEDVQQEKLNAKGKSEEHLQSSFEYMVLAQNQANEPTLFESREALKQAHSKKNVSLLVTNGFATQLLIFHPYYQSSFTFDRLADAHVNGRSYVQVHFQHVRGRPTPAALLLRGREYPLSLSGVARIDAASGAVEYIETELGSSMEDLGLKSFHSQVEYAPVALPQAKNYLLPAVATVEVNSTKQHWKNVHRFTNYRLFSVSVSESVDVDKIKQKDQ